MLKTRNQNTSTDFIHSSAKADRMIMLRRCCIRTLRNQSNLSPLLVVWYAAREKDQLDSVNYILTNDRSKIAKEKWRKPIKTNISLSGPRSHKAARISAEETDLVNISLSA